MRFPTPHAVPVSRALGRSAALALALVLTVAATLFTAGVAEAQTNPIGTLSFDPASGIDRGAPTVTTSAPCPAASNAFHIRMTGPGGLDNLANGRTQAGFSTTNPITATFTNTFKDVAALDTPPVTIVAGSYTVSLNCVSGLGSTIEASFVSTVTFTSPTAYTTAAGPGPGPGPGPGATATMTALAVTPVSPAAGGTVETLTATLTPSTATGTVQFLNGTTKIGGAMPVSGGKASTTTTLPAGTASLTAVLTGGPGFANSTSSVVSYVVNGAGDTATSTTTTLATSPASPVAKGAGVELKATVTPSGAAGKVQFKDGETPIGEPVTVTGGAASTTTSTLAVGTHSLLAVFTPTSAAAFTPSTSSAVSMVVTGSPATTTEPDATSTTGNGDASPSGTGSGGNLAFTGAPLETLAATGLALSALGIGLILAARRRRVG